MSCFAGIFVWNAYGFFHTCWIFAFMAGLVWNYLKISQKNNNSYNELISICSQEEFKKEMINLWKKFPSKDEEMKDDLEQLVFANWARDETPNIWIIEKALSQCLRNKDYTEKNKLLLSLLKTLIKKKSLVKKQNILQ